MTSLLFDTLEYAKKAKEVGFTESQAEFQARLIAELISEKLATKDDIQMVKDDIQNVKDELEDDIELLKIELKKDINELSYKLIVSLGGIVVIGIGALATILKLLL